MKKIYVIGFMIAATFCFCLLSSCGKRSTDEQLIVYSFSGENENFSISNGVIVLTPTQEIFYGGNLEGELSDIVAYSMTFYILSGKDERILLSNSVTDMTGETINVAGDSGKISGGILKETEIDELQNNLFFELKTTNQNGEENTYQLQLVVTEVTAIQEN